LLKYVHERVGALVARGQYRRALDLLDRTIEDPLPLFSGEAWVAEERRLAWLYRIDLLRDLNRLTQALAWACLEAELNPDNVAAIALKQRLKREAGFLPPQLGKDSAPRDLDAEPLSRWRGVAGMRDLKAMLERDVILPLLEPEVYEKYRVSLPSGILLYGPPGCGKTFIARKLAEIIGFAFTEVKPGDIASIFVHGTQGRIAKIFDDARGQAPSMLFFDEIDAMIPSRSADSVGHHYASEVNEFLVRLNECGRQKILVVGATNLPSRLDPAVLRPGRLDKKFFVAPPDYEARHELLRLYMRDRPQETVDWHTCATELDSYTCAEIEFVVNEAARTALGSRRNIVSGDILRAAEQNPPAHTADTIEVMRTF
jgi:SpoVK/Ycf46/Vps4 family AAA+-type ATPase